MKIKTKRYYIYYLSKISLFIVGIFPIKLGLWVADMLGPVAACFMKKEYNVAVENLKDAFPEKTDVDIKKIATKIFSNLCKNGVEWANIYKLTKKTIDRWIRIEGIDKVNRALSKGKGIIVLTAHFGNWELVAFSFLLKGYPGSAVVRRIYFDGYQNLIERIRKSKGFYPIYRDESPKKILKFLKNNGILGILGDQDIDSVDGVFVDFFGKPAYTPKAPVAIALASGATIIPCFIIREENHHRLVIEDPIELEEKPSSEETIRFNTQKWSRVTESYIRRYPEQWVWMHRRWKTKPPYEV